VQGSRSLRLDDEAERKLLPVAEQPLKDIIMLMRDTGMRNVREPYRLRIENIDFNNRVIFNPNSKTAKGRRFIPINAFLPNSVRLDWKRKHKVPPGLRFADTSRNDDAVDTLFLKPI